MNSLQMDANFLAPRGNVYGGYALGGVAEFGGIYGGRGTAEGAKKAREAKKLKHGAHPHAHKKVPELKAEAKLKGIKGFSKMKKHELHMALGHHTGAQPVVVYVEKPKKEKKEKKERKTKVRHTAHSVGIANLPNQRDVIELRELGKMMKMSLKKLEKLKL
jgi:hypothetical protein